MDIKSVPFEFLHSHHGLVILNMAKYKLKATPSYECVRFESLKIQVTIDEFQRKIRDEEEEGHQILDVETVGDISRGKTQE